MSPHTHRHSSHLVLAAVATVLALAAAGLAVLWWDIPLLPDS